MYKKIYVCSPFIKDGSVIQVGRPSPIIEQPQCHVWIRDSLPAIQHNFFCNSKLKYLNTHTKHTHTHIDLQNAQAQC